MSRTARGSGGRCESNNKGNTMDWVTITALSIYAILLIAHFVSTRWVAGRIQYSFDEKIEKLRTELRKNEERLKSDLRKKRS
jgi:hypothetical protein